MNKTMNAPPGWASSPGMKQANDPPMPIAARRIPQVEDQMDALDRTISRLSELCERLQSKLHAVSREYEGAPCDPSPPEPLLVPLADGIRGFTRRVSNVADQLDDLYLRVEL